MNLPKPKHNFPVTYRDITPEDISFVYSTWLKSYRNTDWAKSMSNDTFFLHHKEIITNILNDPTTKVTLICDKEDPSVLYGYVVAQQLPRSVLVHYCYMKYNFRKLHIMSELIDHLGYFSSPNVHFITHLPRNYLQYYKKRYNLEYNPYLINQLT